MRAGGGTARVAVVGLLVVAGIAWSDNIVVNGNLSSEMDGWTAFSASKGNAMTIPPQAAALSNGADPSFLPRFQAGHNPARGARDLKSEGTRQNLFFPTGVAIPADAAAQSTSAWKRDAGGAELLVNSKVVARYDLGNANRGELKVATLTASVLGDGARRRIAVEFVRPANSGYSSVQYVRHFQVFDFFGGAPPLDAPEPATIALCGAGLLLLATRKRIRSIGRPRE